MSKIATELFDGLKRMGSEIGAEVSRLNKQATNELASAIFTGNAFVQYGPGQQTQEPEQQKEIEQQQEISIDR
jgi:hypothetical protein